MMLDLAKAKAGSDSEDDRAQLTWLVCQAQQKANDLYGHIPLSDR